MEPCDLVGMPTIVNGRTQFCPPDSLPTGGEGILVLEEINRAPEYMRAPCLQLLSARCLNGYALPDGWLPWGAINPAEEGYQAAELDPAFLTRFVVIVVVPDRGEWALWAREQGLDPRVVAYVLSDPTIFESPKSNPRSWAHVSRLLQADRQLKTPPALLRAAVAGCVGAERAVAFGRYLQGDTEPLKAEAVLSSYRAHRKGVRAWLEEGRLEYLQGTLLNVEKQLQSQTNFDAVRGAKRAWANLGLFIADLPGDLRRQAEQFFREHGYPLPLPNRRATK
jgi:MoxR-like ATPase